MESSPGTGVPAHGPMPDASQTLAVSTSASTSPPQPQTQQQPESPSGLPEPPTLSRQASQQHKRSSLSSLPPRGGHKGARHHKRLTLNFPINFALNSPAASASTPTSDPTVSSPGSMTPISQSARASPLLPAGTPLPLDAQDDGYDFLRAIASQERKVLELREELQRAETDLATLKKQWALSERSRKRTEISYHAEQMMPLRAPDSITPDSSSPHRRDQSLSSGGSSSVSQDRRSRELEQHSNIRAAASGGTKISANGRRVFQGSHTRTLSLLSPVTEPGNSAPDGSESYADRLGRTPRSATLPSVERKNVPSVGEPPDESQVPEHLLSQWRKTMPPASREALMRTGKQMASDLREGLWTFLEDIRQATVGEEGINATQSRTMSPPNANSLAAPTARKRDSGAKSRSRERLSAAGGKSSRSSSSSRAKGPAAETTISGKDTKPADISTSFWNEFGVDTPAQKSPSSRRSPSDHTTVTATPSAATEKAGPPEHSSSSAADAEDETADNWDAWDTPLSSQKMTHTPSSSRSTVESKNAQSPTTQGSSPRTSASFGDWNPTSAAPDPSVTEGIPWPSLSKLAPSKLQRTASNLMAEWERSLSPSPERKGSSLAPNTGKESKKD